MKLTHRRRDGTQVRVRKKIRGDSLKLTVIETAPNGERKTSETSLSIPPTKEGEPNKVRKVFVQKSVEASLHGTAPASQPKPAKPPEPKKEPAS